MNKLHHECGICSVISKNKKNILNKTIFLLSKLQHRGQDSCGVCYIKNNDFKLIKDVGLIKNVLNNIKDGSTIAIAHTRYSTKGEVTQQNAQPILFKDVAIVHNGTIFDIEKYRKILLEKGFSFEGNNDSEVILKWLFLKIQKDSKDWLIDDIKKALETIEDGAYSIILMFKDRIIAFKDEFSYRPLMFIETKENYIISSEDIVTKAVKKLEIKGNSFIEIKKDKALIKEYPIKNQRRCPFEVIYFAKNNVFKKDIKTIRKYLGKILATYDKNLNADFVVPIVNSGLHAAKGYSRQSKIKFKKLIKLKSPLRTFIENSSKRFERIEDKYIIKNVKNKDIILVDDSIVRGTTSKKIVEMLKSKGAKKIHLRLISPMIINSCFWGVDIPNKDNLLAYKLKSQDNIKKELNIDSVKFISFDDFFKYFNKNLWCNKCFKS